MWPFSKKDAAIEAAIETEKKRYRQLKAEQEKLAELLSPPAVLDIHLCRWCGQKATGRLLTINGDYPICKTCATVKSSIDNKTIMERLMTSLDMLEMGDTPPTQEELDYVRRSILGEP